MDGQHDNRERRIFEETLALPEADRPSFIRRACGDDHELEERIRRLLRAHERAGEARTTVVPDWGLVDEHPKQIGPYRIVERIGEGGMGTVYVAEQRHPMRRRVALKIIKLGMDTKSVIARFEAERQALALMDHPCIAKVFDAGSTPRGRPYFAMEYVPGIPITAYGDKYKLAVGERLELFIRLCDGVQHAHQKAIIHRDLKPSNVLVTIQDDEPVPKIIDFGVAKAMAQRLTEKTVHTALGEMIGTPEYMSPEQAAETGDDIDTRADVYALGVILYELLVGTLPLEPAELRRAGFEGIVRMIREQDPMRPSTRVSTLGERATEVANDRSTVPVRLTGALRGDLDWITMRALEKDRTRRYGSPAEMAADLRRHLRHEPVLAGPPGATYRMRKFVRRHRLGVGIGGAAAVLLVGFAVTMAVQAERIAWERDRANLEAERANEQAERANAAAERANEEAQAAQQVTEFMVGLFDKLDPRSARGQTVTAQQILDVGAARIAEGKMERAPLLQARLLEAMARVYQNQGEYARAGDLWENAVAVRRKEQGDKHPDLGRTLRRLGWLRGAYQEDLANAREALLEAVAILQQAHGPRHIETGWTLYYLGSALVFAGRDPCGAEYLERARLVFEDTLGAESLPVSWCWQDMGSLFEVAGDYPRAFECYERATEIKKRRLPSGDPDIATSETALAYTMIMLGRCAEAKPILDQALRTCVESYGWDHDHTAAALTNVAVVQRCLGEYEEARRSASRAREIFLTTQGPPDRYVHAQRELVFIALETGKFSEADSLARVVEHAIERTRGRESLEMALLLEGRATALQKIGREMDAAALQDRVRMIRTRWRDRLQTCDDT